MDDSSQPGAESGAHAPVPVSLLADLQSGLLDDDTAARVRHRIRADPDAATTAAALDRVRRDLAGLGSSPPSSDDLPEVPAAVTARLTAALATATSPDRRSHAARGSVVVRPRTVGLLVGGLAALAAVGIGVTSAVDDSGARTPSAGVTADRITVSRVPAAFPVPRDELLALLDRPTELGALADPARRSACLSALGFPGSAAVLGADTLDVDGRPVVLLLLAGGASSTMTALAVAPTCDVADPGLVAETVVARA